MVSTDLSKNWVFAAENSDVFRPIAVPGDINDALFKAGVLPDPFVGIQFREYFPHSAQGWIFKTEFDKPDFKENADLVFNGITGAAKIFLNGTELGEARNAHRPHRFDVTAVLKDKNELTVVFEPVEKSIGAPRRDEFGWGNERTFLRTPPFNYGWDWSVPVPSTGLTAAVVLECDTKYRWVNINYRTPEPGRADFFFEVSRATRDKGYDINFRLHGHGVDIRKVIPGRLDVPRWAVEEGNIFSQHRVFTSIKVENAKLWMPNTMGEAALYEYEAEIVIDGEVKDVQRGRLGFRTVRAVEFPFREESGPGFSYELEVNGIRTFIKGSNWVPVHLWPGAAEESQYRRLLERAKAANFNMIRIWGGGVYERDIFYDLCDEYGIMVWQDFMFASNAYPLGVLREEIKLEAEYQLKRLRLHPCICHWCGINEDVFSWAYPGCGRLKDLVQADFGDYTGSANWQFHDDPELYGMLLRGMTSQMGNGVPYTESSPQSHGDCGNLPQSGNCHLNGTGQARNYPEQFRDHFLQVCSFDSEAAIQGPDSGRNTRKFMGEDECRVWPPEHEDIWEAHVQRGHGQPLWFRQNELAEKLIGPVTDFDTFIKFGQTAHIELLRNEFEYSRLNRPDCGGMMTWMYNDCWPTGSWSIINFAGAVKPAYYQARRSSAACLPLVLTRGDYAEFAFDNQTLQAQNIKAEYGLMKLDGTKIWSRTADLTCPANELLMIEKYPLANDKLEKGDHYYIKVEGYAVVRCYPNNWKGIRWPESTGTMTQVAPGVIRVTANDGYLRMAHLAPLDPERIVDFSDNYFDLGIGESIDIETDVPAEELKLLHWNTEWEIAD